MTILIGFLTTILVLNCIFLILLVLIQLPKKEAGIGMAFGGAATETLFGAGSGTVLTKATKYAAGLFMGLSLLLAILNSHQVRKTDSAVDLELQRQLSSAPAAAAPAGTNVQASTVAPTAPASTVPAPTATSGTPTLLLSTPAATTNAAQ